MFTAFPDPTHSGEFLFLPPVHGEGERRVCQYLCVTLNEETIIQI